MMAVLRANSVHDWAFQFLQALANEAEGTEFDEPLRQAGVPDVYDKTLMGSNARSRRSSQMNSGAAEAQNRLRGVGADIEATIERNPFAAVLIALSAGFLIGMLRSARR